MSFSAVLGINKFPYRIYFILLKRVVTSICNVSQVTNKNIKICKGTSHHKYFNSEHFSSNKLPVSLNHKKSVHEFLPENI